MTSIVVGGRDGHMLSYIDSGAPSGDYITLFAIHGTAFTCNVFQKIMGIAAASRVRIVALNRRDYPGSTLLSDKEKAVLDSGTDEEKAEFLKQRGLEVSTFIKCFDEENPISPIKGETGGFAILGWSLGSSIALAAVANLDSLPTDKLQTWWGDHLRALILYEPPTVAVGTPYVEKFWTPLIDTTMPEDCRVPFFLHWITSYFNHGDLDSRNIDVLSFVVPSPSRAPSIYGMTEEELAHITHTPPTLGSDMSFMVSSGTPIKASYKKACYDMEIRKLVHNMKITLLNGAATAPFSILAFWAMQDDDKANGGGNIDFKMLPGVNHFVHVADPELAMKTFLEAM